MRAMPTWLRQQIDAEIAAHTNLTAGQREAARKDSYTQVQRYIDTHQPGPYPAWGEHSNHLARSCVRDACVRALSAGQRNTTVSIACK
jgi:hypothetical protein